MCLLSQKKGTVLRLNCLKKQVVDLKCELAELKEKLETKNKVICDQFEELNNTVGEAVKRLRSVKHEQKTHREMTTDKKKKTTQTQSVFVKEKRANKVKPVETANNTDDNTMNVNTKKTHNQDKKVTDMHES